MHIDGNDLNFGTVSINDTWLVNQAIGNYTFTTTGGTLNIKNKSAGQIKFLQTVSGVNTTLSNRIFITNNFARIDEYTTLLNKSTEITLYNIPTTSTELEIRRNGIVCNLTTSPTCINLTSMQAGNVTFNTTSGGNYSILASTSSPTIVLSKPEDNFNTSQQNINFNFTAADDVSSTLNCNIYLDSFLNQTNSSVNSGNLTNFLIENIAEGNHSWYIECFDGGNNVNVSETRRFNISIPLPTVTLNYPRNNSYFDSQTSVQFNYTAYALDLRNMTVWFYRDGNPLNTSYNITNGTTLTYNWTGLDLGQHNWTVIANNGIYNSTNNYSYFNLVNLTINCETGGPYRSGGLVLIQGNISNGISGLSSQSINASLYKEGTFNVSRSLTSLNDGSFQTSFSILADGNYTLNASFSYQGYNKSCVDNFNVGGELAATSASFVLDKIASFHNLTNETFTYNITLKLTNKGGSSATNVNITDLDYIDYNFSIETLGSGETITKSYLLNFTRNSTTYYNSTAIAQAFGIDSFSNSLISTNSSSISLTIPSTETGEQLTIIKNIVYNNQTSNNVNYTVSVQVVNSGGLDVVNAELVDSDLNKTVANPLIISRLNRTESYTLSGDVIIRKFSENYESLFEQVTVTVGENDYLSNIIKIIIPGYGNGPNDLTVDAPASVIASTEYSTALTIVNMNKDIGQDFTIDYWVTNTINTTNYSIGSKTLFVAANSGSNSTIANFNSPPIAGTYIFMARVRESGKDASDSFVVNAPSSRDTGGDTGGSSGGGGITGAITYPKHLMDISTRILDEYKFIHPGDKVLMELSLYNLGTEEIKDAKLRYCIETTNKEIIKCSEEVVAVYTRIQLVKEFLISLDTKKGEYFIKTEATYGNDTVYSETSFEVTIEENPTAVSNDKSFNLKIDISYLITGVIIFIFMILLTLILIILFKRRSEHRQVATIESKLQHLKELKSKGEISEKSYHTERERLLQRIQNIFKGKTMSILLFGISLVALARIFTINKSVTGYVIGVSILNNLTTMLGYFILLIGAFGLLMFMHRQKIKVGVEKINEKLRKKYSKNSVLGLINKKVYSEGGHYIGKVTDIILGKNRIESLKIELDKKHKFKAKRIVIDYKHVKSVSEIIIIDEAVLEHLEKLDPEST